MPEPKLYDVPLTEAQVDALITTIGKVTIDQVHLCRCKAVHEGLEELKNTQTLIRKGEL